MVFYSGQYQPRNTFPNFQRPNTRFMQNTGRQNLPAMFNSRQATDLASRGVGGLSQTLGNVQQVVKMFQTATPIIQQYGPMVKNIPTMYRVMKALRDVDSDTDDTKKKSTRNNTKSDKKEDPEVRPAKRVEYGLSTPKLYI